MAEEKALTEERKILMEEHYLPDNEGLLGSKTTSMGSDGSIRKELKVPFCDSCGQALSGQGIAVCSCRRKICQSCTIIHENKIYCRECAKQMTALTKRDFFILYGVANEISLNDIKHCSFLSSEVMEESLSELIQRNLIECKGLSFFSRYVVTDSGLALLATCEQIFRKERDVSLFITRLSESLSEG